MENNLISLIIPTFNEAQRLGNTLRSVISYFQTKQYDFEIIVVDDGSTDKTQEVFLKIVTEFPMGKLKFIKNKTNHGKGYVVRQGVLQATKEYVFFSDADLSTPIYEIEKLLNALKGGFDIAIGSRAVDRSLVKKHQPWYRDFTGRFFNLGVQIWTVPGIKDTQCGFKGFKKKAALAIFKPQKLTSFIFDVEILYIGRKLGLKIAEIPVEWFNNEDTRYKPSLSNFLTMWKDLIRVRFLH